MMSEGARRRLRCANGAAAPASTQAKAQSSLHFVTIGGMRNVVLRGRLRAFPHWGTIVRTIDIRTAKARLSELIDEAVKGEPFVIAKASKPLVKVSALEVARTAKGRRLGFLSGKIEVPDDFDSLAATRLADMGGSEPGLKPIPRRRAR